MHDRGAGVVTTRRCVQIEGQTGALRIPTRTYVRLPRSHRRRHGQLARRLPCKSATAGLPSLPQPVPFLAAKEMDCVTMSQSFIVSDNTQRGGASMPELPICIYCDRVISLGNDEYVVTNKMDDDGEVRSRAEWLYAHASCHEKETSKKLTE